jgi:phosphoserine phosphatase
MESGDTELSQVLLNEVTPVKSRRPLCVDLDGTLVKSDTLMDSLLLLARAHPFMAVKLPIWALRGKAYLKSKIASCVSLDVHHLPYNRVLITYLKEERANGRKLYLVTGADQKLAIRVAAHLGMFEEVLASDGAQNLTGETKLGSLRQRFGEVGYDYIGNSHVDLPLLEHAGIAMIANPARLLRTRLRSRGVSSASVGKESAYSSASPACACAATPGSDRCPYRLLLF